MRGEDLEGRRIVVTGATGFVGSHLCDALHDLKAHVVGIAKVTSRCDLWRRSAIEPVAIKLADVRRLRRVAAIMRGADTVLHLAAETHVPDSVVKPGETVDVNAMGTLACLEAARRNDVALFVYAGSDKIYGDSSILPFHEGLPPRPRSPYDASKLAGEALCMAYHSTYGIKIALPRFSNIYGPRQDLRKVVPEFITTLLSGKTVAIRGTGESVRDYVYISDMLTAYLALISKPLIAEPVNFGTGVGTRLMDLFSLVARSCGVESVPQVVGQKTPGEIERQYLEIAKAKSVLGWTPTVTLAEGMSRTVEWYRSNLSFWSATRSQGSRRART